MNEVDKYIAGFPDHVKGLLNQIRTVIRETAPDAVECISYGMPAYKLNKKPLVYFAGYARHIGFYATPAGHEKFEAELSRYKQGKGSVQFPIDQPLPLDLVKRIVEFRMDKNL
jgi:uncharacterized protein YdhG (YjbR/CyaY superfamily)